MATLLSLNRALAENRLDQFIDQSEAAKIGPAARDGFDALISTLVRAPLPEDRTSRSPGRGGSPGK